MKQKGQFPCLYSKWDLRRLFIGVECRTILCEESCDTGSVHPQRRCQNQTQSRFRKHAPGRLECQMQSGGDSGFQSRLEARVEPILERVPVLCPGSNLCVKSSTIKVPRIWAKDSPVVVRKPCEYSVKSEPVHRFGSRVETALDTAGGGILVVCRELGTGICATSLVGAPIYAGFTARLRRKTKAWDCENER
jgi:hypothetical protein